MYNIVMMPGDRIGPEVFDAALVVLKSGDAGCASGAKHSGRGRSRPGKRPSRTRTAWNRRTREVADAVVSTLPA